MSRAVVITGLSGSGKSSAAKCFEDAGYYCVDNLPLKLLREFLLDPLAHVQPEAGIAVVTDVRAPGFAEEFPRLVAEIDDVGVEPVVLFLDASDEALVRRYSETRRSHPLADADSPSEGIQRERELLADVRAVADLVYDTSEWTIHQIRAHVMREFGAAGAAEEGMAVNVMSFGFKYGIPYGADLLLDVRFLPNPHFVAGLREQTGLDAPVLEYLENEAEYQEFLDRSTEFLEFLLPRYRREHRSYLSIAIGCTGGRHRSVAVAEALTKRFQEAGWTARVTHRDVHR